MNRVVKIIVSVTVPEDSQRTDEEILELVTEALNDSGFMAHIVEEKE